MIPFNLTLNTPRCTLRIVSEGDVPLVWSVSRFLDLPMECFGTRRWINKSLSRSIAGTLEAWRAGRAFTFTVVLKATQLPVGRIGIHVEAQEDVWTIGFWIAPERWGQGLAAEAVKAVIEFGFSRLDAKSFGVRTQRGMCKANECSKSSVCAYLVRIQLGLKRMARRFRNLSML